MSVITLTRVTVDPAHAGELVAAHAKLVSVLRAPESGLGAAEIGRLDQTTWIAVWRWETAAHLAAARKDPTPEAAAAFGLTTTQSVEQIEVPDPA